MRRRRRALDPGVQRCAARLLARRLGRLAVFCRARHVAFYAANDGEIDLLAARRHAAARGKCCYLPVLYPGRRRWVYFAPVTERSRYAQNYFGILEPDTPARHWKTPRQLDLILVPLVAFDARGNRVGMGGGFYDRSLAYLEQRRHWKRPLLLGVAHDCQRTDAIRGDAWDVPLDAVVTDRAYYGAAGAHGTMERTE